MKKYNLIILAGGEDELWCQHYGHKKKALLPVAGKPMLDWVIEAFQRSEYIDNIVVVGPKELDQLESMRYIRKHLPEEHSFIQNLLCGLFYVKTSIYRFANTHNGYLISFCDAVFLTADSINATIKNIIEEHDPEIGLHYVQKETIAKNGYPTQNRSYMHIANKYYTGSNIYYIKKITKLLGLLNDITLLRKYRKDPEEMLKHLGCKDKDFCEIEQVLSNKFSTRIKIFVSPYAEMGVDVDKPIDYEFAQAKFLKKPENKTSPDIYTELRKSRYINLKT